MRTVKPFGRRLPAGLPRVSLCDRNPEVLSAFLDHFHEVAGVEILEGDLLRLDRNALIRPSNSFGYMDGGLDQHIDRFYEGAAQNAVLATIAGRFYGELAVGSATIVEMTTGRFPFLVVSPTMMVPGDVSGTINAYLALRAGLIAVLDHVAYRARRMWSPGPWRAACTGRARKAAGGREVGTLQGMPSDGLRRRNEEHRQRSGSWGARLRGDRKARPIQEGPEVNVTRGDSAEPDTEARRIGSCPCTNDLPRRSDP